MKVKNNLLYILYDSIENSVFVNQILQPLMKQLEKNENLQITILSFEKKRPLNNFLIKTIPAHDRLNLILSRRLKFFGKLSLYFSAYQLKKLLDFFIPTKIITRGPLSAWITFKVLKQKKLNKKIPVVIQARGLAAEEFRFTSQYMKKNIIKRIFRKFIYKKLRMIEKEAYCEKNNFRIAIEAVSPTLKEYLIKKFKAEESKIYVAQNDLPENFDREDVKKYYKKIREKLKIPQTATVYCYNGSYKPWQCAEETLSYFEQKYKDNPNNFLLILSQDKKNFTQTLKMYNIPKTNFKILQIQPQEIYKYLAACDIGFLFRKKDVINWVSRPTKMLEYKAVGLEILHNNTIAWLTQ